MRGDCLKLSYLHYCRHQLLHYVNRCSFWSTGVKLFLGSKVLCALFWKSISLPFPPLPSGVQISIQDTHGTFDPINILSPVYLWYEWCKQTKFLSFNDDTNFDTFNYHAYLSPMNRYILWLIIKLVIFTFFRACNTSYLFLELLDFHLVGDDGPVGLHLGEGAGLSNLEDIRACIKTLLVISWTWSWSKLKFWLKISEMYRTLCSLVHLSFLSLNN